MDDAIREVLDVLEAAENEGVSLTDSVLREALYDVLYQGLIDQVPGYEVPEDLLLNYTPAAEEQNGPVVRAMKKFLTAARRSAQELGLHEPADREDAFLNSEATSSSGEVSVASYFD